jgi:hypothetical protein
MNLAARFLKPFDRCDSRLSSAFDLAPDPRVRAAVDRLFSFVVTSLLFLVTANAKKA